MDRDYKSGEERETDFFDVKVFGRRTEFIEKYIKKGTKIEVTGRLQQDKWTDKDGNKKYAISIIADRIGFAESKSASQSQGSNETKKTLKEERDEFVNLPTDIDESLPFA